MTGSAVLAVYGAELRPNDLDVTPELSQANLARLAEALTEVEAIPAFVPEWRNSLSVEACHQWNPTPPTEQNLDHMFVTSVGMLDVPPRLCGTYDELLPASTTVDIAGVPVRVCDPQEVLSRLAGRTRGKDLARREAYESIQRQPAAQRAPTGIPALLERLDAGR